MSANVMKPALWLYWLTTLVTLGHVAKTYGLGHRDNPFAEIIVFAATLATSAVWPIYWSIILWR